MRHSTLLLAALAAIGVSGQAPEAFSYQAVARNASGDALVNTAIGIRFQLYQGTPAGTLVYAETHAPVTNDLGLFTLQVGNGTPTQGTFAAIDWSSGPYFLDVGLDPAGGTSYTSIGTQQLLSVPYALHAKTVDTDNDVQQLTISGDTLFISGGNYIVLPSRFTTNCADGLLNGDETGVDCGGTVCVSCDSLGSDGVQNGDETGVDCGGSSTVSCDSLCNDGIQNGDETDVDCGGISCVSCATLCSDGLQNGGETGVDCGGICAPCPTCSDGLQNGTETAVDCGGSCPPCCNDADGDGVNSCAGDCNDGDPAISPLDPEICGDAIDNNCNGTVDELVDGDGDGWSTCSGDCNDANDLVNPGAYEIAGNGIDDNCNGTVDEAAAVCSTVADFSAVTATNVAQAMGLCQTTTVNPPLPLKIWGLISATQLLSTGAAPNGTQLSNMQNLQCAVLQTYGTGGVVPTSGATMAGLSTGRMRDANDAGYVAPNSGTNLATASTPPTAYTIAHGNSLLPAITCNGVCPVGTGAYDPVNVRLQIRVPTNASGFSYQYRFFSSEYQSYWCSQYNDHHLALLTSSAPGLPADKNIAHDSQGNPVSVNNVNMTICPGNGTCHLCPNGVGPLTGTGMEVGNTGSGSPWLTVQAPVVPGETITLDLMVFDVSDGTFDSNLLLDNFQWIPVTP